MQTDVRTRVLLPVVMPVLIVLAMVAFIGVFALILLFGTHSMSLVLAIVAAGGILFTVTLATSQDRLDPVRRGVLGVAILTPFILGGLVASGVLGEIPEGERMIDVEAELEAPEDAVLAADNLDSFCEYDAEADACGDQTDSWEVAAQGAEQFLYEFVNLHEDVTHDLTLYELEGDADAPEAGETIHDGEDIAGPGESVELVTPGLEAGEYYFDCTFHPTTMTGVLEVTDEGGDDQDEGGDDQGEGGDEEA